MKIEMYTKKLYQLISSYLERNEIDVFSIGFVLSFDNSDSPQFLLAICTQQEVVKWVAEYGEYAKYYIWNPAEYNIFDRDEILYNETIDLLGCDERDCYIEKIVRIVSEIKKNMRKDIYFYVCDLDEDDYEYILTRTLTKKEIMKLKQLNFL